MFVMVFEVETIIISVMFSIGGFFSAWREFIIAKGLRKYGFYRVFIYSPSCCFKLLRLFSSVENKIIYFEECWKPNNIGVQFIVFFMPYLSNVISHALIFWTGRKRHSVRLVKEGICVHAHSSN